MQLHPREQFTIVRQLQNPYITDTFYVRAVIRNAKTDTIIATLNLTDKTGQRFTKTWQVPVDVSGQGFWISIITSVYTDSGYATKSQNYGDEENTYLIQERYLFNPNYPVGADIDYKKIKKMIDVGVKKVIEEIGIIEPKVVTVTNEVVKEVIKEVRVPEIKVVETQKVQDLSPIINEIRAVGKKVDEKPVTEIPEPKEINLAPILDGIEGVSKNISDSLGEVKKGIEDLKPKPEIKSPIDRASLILGNKDFKDERIIRLTKPQ